MGWINQGQLRRPLSRTPAALNEEAKASVAHIEDAAFPFCPVSLQEGDLPYIPADEVKRRDGKGSARLWIVVDELVYDCTLWVNEHPGGDAVIKNFGGEECSWQFWRFHSKKTMKDFGEALRVGRTSGMINRYPEPKRYSRLRGFDPENW